MNIKEQLEEWRNAVTEAGDLLDRIEPIVGCDGPIHQTVSSLMDTYTQTVARAIGDPLGNIEWFWLENDLGNRGLAVKINGETREVRTLDDLLWMLGVDA